MSNFSFGPKLHRVPSMESLEMTLSARLRHRALGQIITPGDEEGYEAYISNGRFNLYLPDSTEVTSQDTDLVRIEFTPMTESSGLGVMDPHNFDFGRTFTVSDREFATGVGVYVRGWLPPTQPRS